MPPGIYKRSAYQIEQVKNLGKNWKNKKRTLQNCINISKGKKGKKMSQIHRENLIKACREESIKRMLGCNNINWKGGISKKVGYIKYKNEKRRCKLLSIAGEHTFGEWENLKKQYNFTCPCCNNSEPFKGQKSPFLTEDHIIPISKGGSNNIENIQPLCGNCNSKKHTKIIKY